MLGAQVPLTVDNVEELIGKWRHLGAHTVEHIQLILDNMPAGLVIPQPRPRAVRPEPRGTPPPTRANPIRSPIRSPRSPAHHWDKLIGHVRT